MPRGAKRRDLPVDEIVRLYVVERWNSYRISEKYGCSQPTILERLREADVILRTAGNHKGRTRQHHLPTAELVELYVGAKWSTDRLAEKYGCSTPTVTVRLREAGVTLRHHNDTKRGAPSPHRHKIDEAAAVRAYTENKTASISEVARNFGCHPNAVLRALDAHGVKRKTLSEIVVGKRNGANNPNWRPDLTADERASRRDNAKTVVWRRQVYERDGFACVICEDDTGGNLNAHHIESYNSCRDLRWVVSNGVTLCVSCHRGFHSRYGNGNNTAAQFAEYRAAS